MTSPAIRTLLPPPTTPRVEMFASVVSEEVDTGATARVAALLTIDPPAEDTVTEYVPASAGCTEPIV
jgi:hypothetical protein